MAFTLVERPSSPVGGTSVIGPPAQRAMVGAKAREVYAAQAKERMVAGKGQDGSGGRGNKKNLPVSVPEGLGDARDLVGKSVGVGGSLIDRAGKAVGVSRNSVDFAAWNLKSENDGASGQPVTARRQIGVGRA